MRTVPTAVDVAIPTVAISKFKAGPPKLWRSPSTLFFPWKALTQPHKLVNSVFPAIPANAEFVSSCSVSPESTSGGGINASDSGHWMVLVKDPSPELREKPQIIDYYVDILASISGSEQAAQSCIYHASCVAPFGFCCEIDEETALKLASIAGILSVKPDHDVESARKDYSSRKPEPLNGSNLLFPVGTTKKWIVRMERPAIGAIRKAQVVDYYVQVLMRVLRNEQDAQICIYHVSWQTNYGFCCELDQECAQELAAMPGVLSVVPDDEFVSYTRDYGVPIHSNSQSWEGSSLESDFRTKKLFVTGLSFYTSEKTLRAAFEGFGELVEVKIIMDKISKRSKGYGFVEYTTEEAAMTALREMNGKIINGWMITVDVAKMNPPKYSKTQPTSSLW